MNIQMTNEDIFPKNQHQQSQMENSVEEIECRICFGVQLFGNVICPCKCKSYVHPACLNEWMKRKKNLCCEVCLAKYEIQFRKKYYCSVQKIQISNCQIIKKITNIIFFFVLFLGSTLLFSFRSASSRVQITITYCIIILTSLGASSYLLVKFILVECIFIQIQIQL